MADQSLAVTASYSTTAAPATPDTVTMAGRTAPRAAQTAPRVIYLAGLGRSGSTLLERLVGELPGACAVGEVVHLWHRSLVHNERCGCGVPFAECDFWRQVGDAGFGGWFMVDPLRVARLRAGVDRNRFVPLLAGPTLPSGLRRTHEEYVSYYRRLYTAVSEVTGCDAVVDSSKHPSLAFCLGKAAGLDVRVIHVVRDSRAVAYSWGERAARPDGGVEAYMRQLRPTSSAAQWTGHNALMHLMDRTDIPMMRVRYEDVVHTPAAVLREIASFAGLTAEDGSLGFLGEDDAGHWAQLAPAHTVSGHGLRFSTGKIAIRPDERWQTAMPPAHRRVVTAATFPLLARYGYVRLRTLTGHGPAGATSGSPGPD